jgi:UDP-glucuronate 4-epimerase
VDNLNDDFEQRWLKQKRALHLIDKFPDFKFDTIDITDSCGLNHTFQRGKFDVVYHLAAQPGVTQSMREPRLFTEANLVGFANVLEACRIFKISHLIFASSSSVYGETSWSTDEETPTDHPKSYYAATKKANEVMASSYSSMYGLRISGCRFFTVYGPWGRPDMATWKFADAILNDKPLTLFDGGSLSRDFTYIDDVVNCLVKMSDCITVRPHLSALSRYQVYNIGTSKPIKVSTYVKIMEKVIGKKALTISQPASVSEVAHTFSDMTKFRRHYSSELVHTDVETGLANFVSWMKQYRK